MARTYATKLAKDGFITIAYDASYQGKSTGEPRQLENPFVRTEDVSAVIDYLTTLPYVDNDRIGAMGICAGAGYNAAINDHRIKAVGTVSAVNIGQMFRNGFTNSVKSADAIPLLVNGSNARTAEANGAEITRMPLAPMKKEDAPNADLEEAWEYATLPVRNIRPLLVGRQRGALARSSRGGFSYAAVADRRGKRGGQQMDERRLAQTRWQERQAHAHRERLKPHEAL